jgi:nucleotide-binding universal stress UspA family protein
MREFKKMLAACDLSAYSEQVLDCAASLADKLGGDLVVVHVINRRNIDALVEAVHKIAPEETALAMSVNEYLESVQRERVEKIEELIRGTSMAGRRIRKVFRVGIPCEEILAVAEAEHADMLVLGSKGKSNIAGLLFGSTAERVLRTSRVPVLTVRLLPSAESQPVP